MSTTIESGLRGDAGAGRSGAEAKAPGAFERLIRVMRENERLLVELGALNGKLRAARTYLLGPDCHEALGTANLNLLKTKRSGLLAMLRANRIEAEAVLGLLKPSEASAARRAS